jgi:site-specific DNA-adenine methylase
LILADSAVLRNTEIRLANVIDVLKSLPPNYFIFLDPPYYGDKKFTDYSGSFNAPHQTELITAILEGPWPFIYTNRAHEFIVNQFHAKTVKIDVIPLRHSVQPKYTTDLVEKEVIIWRAKPN